MALNEYIPFVFHALMKPQAYQFLPVSPRHFFLVILLTIQFCFLFQKVAFQSQAFVFTSWCIFKILDSVTFISFLCTTLSNCPCSNKNSAVWKSSGSFSLIVCSITRLPAKPISALGSLKLRSPAEAKLADMLPLFMFVIYEIYSNPCVICLFKVTLVLPICIKNMIPSCILAPPLAENRMNGKRCSVQYSIILHIF